MPGRAPCGPGRGLGTGLYSSSSEFDHLALATCACIRDVLYSSDSGGFSNFYIMIELLIGFSIQFVTVFVSRESVQ